MEIGGDLGEQYIVRVQLIRSDKEGEYISQSFDYEVSPTTDPSLQAPLFMRSRTFYKKLQAILKSSGGKVTVTDWSHCEKHGKYPTEAMEVFGRDPKHPERMGMRICPLCYDEIMKSEKK